ncbi:MAG: hypothetical protein QOG43_1842 [Actinomycetota bacterium]|nr:hypothetical protein [Actinomycetota bacterium]
MRGADEASWCRQGSDRNGCLGIVAKPHPCGTSDSYSRLSQATSIIRVLSAEWFDGSYPGWRTPPARQSEVPELVIASIVVAGSLRTCDENRRGAPSALT